LALRLPGACSQAACSLNAHERAQSLLVAGRALHALERYDEAIHAYRDCLAQGSSPVAYCGAGQVLGYWVRLTVHLLTIATHTVSPPAWHCMAVMADLDWVSASLLHGTSSPSDTAPCSYTGLQAVPS
jgi:hypothetical protein